MTNKVFLTIILFINSTVSYASGNINSVLNELKVVKETQANFVETRTFSFLNQALISKGTLAYKRPDYIKKNVVQPKPEIYEASGEYLKLVQPDGNTRELLLQNYPVVEAFVNAYRGILSGDKDLLLYHFEISFNGSPDKWRIILRPKDDEAAEIITEIIMEGIHAVPGKITIKEVNGDKSVMSISQK